MEHSTQSFHFFINHLYENTESHQHDEIFHSTPRHQHASCQRRPFTVDHPARQRRRVWFQLTTTVAGWLLSLLVRFSFSSFFSTLFPSITLRLPFDNHQLLPRLPATFYLESSSPLHHQRPYLLRHFDSHPAHSPISRITTTGAYLSLFQATARRSILILGHDSLGHHGPSRLVLSVRTRPFTPLSFCVYQHPPHFPLHTHTSS